ncbi:MAG: TraR/DksA family transcriptional regulator [Desulfovibrionaceae bacterium]|nr:TraR/DksA family transcriptional regulator [Desulfovibrionaceae bacterium]
MTEHQLKEIKTHLVQGLGSMAGQDASCIMAVEGCPDETDFAAQLVQQGINIAMHRRKMARIRELESALKRMSETDYGTCEECGEEIGVARLKANPSARLCVGCQSALEDGLTRCA